jgi:hypothetical protein
MLEKIAPALVVGIITGGISSFGTVSAMQVHISYLRESIERHDKSIENLQDYVRK